MSEAKCGVCLRSMKLATAQISCNACKYSFHAKCSRLSREDFDSYVSSGTPFLCDPCKTKRRVSMRMDSALSSEELSLSAVRDLLIEVRDFLSSRIEESSGDLGRAVEALNVDVQELKVELSAQSDKVNSLIYKVDALENDNKQLREINNQLSHRVDELEQYSRRNCLEIDGFPESPTEDVITSVLEVGRGLGLKVQPDMIDVCHRIPRAPGRSGPRSIIAKFVRRSDKNAFINARRVRRDFSTRHMGRSDDCRVWVKECLSPVRRKLFGAAREFGKKHNFKFVWVKDGKVFIRKSEGSKIINVTSLNVLHSIVDVRLS